MAAIHCNQTSDDLQGIESSLTHANFMITRFSGSSYGAKTSVVELPNFSVSLGVIECISKISGDLRVRSSRLVFSPHQRLV
jgi:hypothetical protein